MRFYYYVDKEGVRQGPLPIEKLTPNEITPDTLVFCKGMKNWQRAKSVDDFYKILNLGDNGTQDAKTTVTESDDSHDGDVLLSSIAARYGVIIDAETSSYIRENVASKLANIKFIKERFNIGLKEAKEIVDDIYATGNTMEKIRRNHNESLFNSKNGNNRFGSFGESSFYHGVEIGIQYNMPVLLRSQIHGTCYKTSWTV